MIKRLNEYLQVEDITFKIYAYETEEDWEESENLNIFKDLESEEEAIALAKSKLENNWFYAQVVEVYNNEEEEVWSNFYGAVSESFSKATFDKVKADSIERGDTEEVTAINSEKGIDYDLVTAYTVDELKAAKASAEDKEQDKKAEQEKAGMELKEEVEKITKSSDGNRIWVRNGDAVKSYNIKSSVSALFDTLGYDKTNEEWKLLFDYLSIEDIATMEKEQVVKDIEKSEIEFMLTEKSIPQEVVNLILEYLGL